MATEMAKRLTNRNRMGDKEAICDGEQFREIGNIIEQGTVTVT